MGFTLKLKKLTPGVIFSLITAFLFIMREPNSIFIVLCAIIISSMAVLSILAVFIPHRIAIVISLGTAIFLTLNYVIGFNIANTTLLAGVISGIIFLLH